MKTIIREKNMRMLKPVHPGLFLRTEIIAAHGLSVTAAAKILRVARPTLSSLLNAKTGLSGEMALRFEESFRRRYRDPDADAEFLRHCADARQCRKDSGRALPFSISGVKAH